MLFEFRFADGGRFAGAGAVLTCRPVPAKQCPVGGLETVLPKADAIATCLRARDFV